MAEKHRVSRLFNLGKSQPTLDFVDVDTSTDTAVFISPKALALVGSDWADGCVSLIQNFFQTILGYIKSGENLKAEKLLGMLREPNETHLGLSSGQSRGRALGDGSAHEVWSALSHSEAAKSGLLQDLEDTILLVPGIGVDIVSDMATNIIRGPLIEYTQQMCQKEGIPLTAGVNSGPMWNATQQKWEAKFVELPMTKFGKILLVPKAIVRRSPQYDLNEYFRHYLLEHLQREELKAGSSLVTILKDGTPKVYKKDIIDKKTGQTKPDIIRETIRDPRPLQQYKEEKARQPFLPLDHDDLANIESTPRPDWEALLNEVISLDSGKENADAYEKAIENLLTALFYPDLVSPISQHNIHDKRKRIDISFTNMAMAGFFNWLSKHYSCAHIFIECKNYGKELGNPELDQISSRFSPSRGQVGVIVARKFEDKSKFALRCRDTAKDQRGYVIALDDNDLRELVEARKEGDGYQVWKLLKQRFSFLID
jgi:hypothetical protein